MSNKAWTIASAVSTICMVGIVIVSAALGGCDSMLECGDQSVPMRCHWAFKATLVLGCVGALSALCTLLAKGKEARRLTAAVTFVIAVACIVMLTSVGVGICTADMECHSNAPFIWALAGTCGIMSVIQVIKGDPEQAELPKMGF